MNRTLNILDFEYSLHGDLERIFITLLFSEDQILLDRKRWGRQVKSLKITNSFAFIHTSDSFFGCSTLPGEELLNFMSNSSASNFEKDEK